MPDIYEVSFNECGHLTSSPFSGINFVPFVFNFGFNSMADATLFTLLFHPCSVFLHPLFKSESGPTRFPPTPPPPGPQPLIVPYDVQKYVWFYKSACLIVIYETCFNFREYSFMECVVNFVLYLNKVEPESCRHKLGYYKAIKHLQPWYWFHLDK